MRRAFNFTSLSDCFVKIPFNMKKILSICILITSIMACQPEQKNTMVITPTPNGVPSASAAPPANQTTSAERPDKNPPHGQPYHDCTIPVGAPLASKPAANLPAAENAVPQAIPSGPQPNDNKEVKLNPPHGEPGHSCAIAVGAPLT